MPTTKTKKFNLRKQLFNWHMWAGIIFSIPVLAVSITAVFIAHEHGLGTKQIMVDAGWMPGYQSYSKNYTNEINDIKGFYKDDDITLYGTKLGLIQNTNGQSQLVKGTEGYEIRGILKHQKSFFVASKYGLLKYENGTITKIKKGDFHGISASNNQLTALVGKYGIIQSQDNGITWSKAIMPTALIGNHDVEIINKGIKDSPEMANLSLEKLILDIHTGKAFLGDGAMWVWIDLVGLSLILMTVTGLWMWYKRKYGKKKRKPALKTSIVAKTVSSPPIKANNREVEMA